MVVGRIVPNDAFESVTLCPRVLRLYQLFHPPEEGPNSHQNKGHQCTESSDRWRIHDELQTCKLKIPNPTPQKIKL